MRDRRQFLSALIRGGIFTSLGLVSGLLIRRWGDSDKCPDNYTCNKCMQSDQCRLPEADKYRLEEARHVDVRTHNGEPGK